MRTLFALAFMGLISLSAWADGHDPVPSYLRTAIFVRDAEATAQFFAEVMGYNRLTDGTLPAAGADNPLGVPEGTESKIIAMTSTDGAGLSIMQLQHPDLDDLARPAGGGNSFGDVMFVHRVKNIAEIEKRARDGGYDVISGAKPSRSGRSLQMFLRDPNGIRLELYEMLPAEE